MKPTCRKHSATPRSGKLQYRLLWVWAHILPQDPYKKLTLKVFHPLTAPSSSRLGHWKNYKSRGDYGILLKNNYNQLCYLFLLQIEIIILPFACNIESFFWFWYQMNHFFSVQVYHLLLNFFLVYYWPQNLFNQIPSTKKIMRRPPRRKTFFITRSF